MNILEITGEPIGTGGQEMFIINVLRHINMKDLKIDLLTPYYCENEIYREEVVNKGGQVYCIGLPFAPGGFRWNIMKPLNRFLKVNCYDVVHIHSGKHFYVDAVFVCCQMEWNKKDNSYILLYWLCEINEILFIENVNVSRNYVIPVGLLMLVLYSQVWWNSKENR